MIIRLAPLGAAYLTIAACVSFPAAPPARVPPTISGAAAISVDGASLGLSKWQAAAPHAILLAVHGMNDYAGAFALAGPYWAERGVSVYAYDQRGFGRSPEPGRWPGGDALKQDLRAVIAAVRAEHPGMPLFALGHSMGAGVILAAMKEAPLDADGVILASPGIWGGASMPIFYRATLALAAAFAPGKTLTGERAGRQASDNIDFLRAMYRDPNVLKETRIDAVLGAVRIMGDGWDASDETGGNILFLYGDKDEIIPVRKMKKAARRLCGDIRVVSFADSWHLIFADLGREQPMAEVAGWIAEQVRRPQIRTGDPEPAVSNCAGKSGHGGSAT